MIEIGTYHYETEITGIIKEVRFDLGPSFHVEIRGDDGRRYEFELHELPTPEDEDPEDFWNQYIGKHIRIRDERTVEAHLLED